MDPIDKSDKFQTGSSMEKGIKNSGAYFCSVRGGALANDSLWMEMKVINTNVSSGIWLRVESRKDTCYNSALYHILYII